MNAEVQKQELHTSLSPFFKILLANMSWSLTVKVTLLPQSSTCNPSTLKVWEERSKKTEDCQKKLLITSVFLSVATTLPVLLIKRVHFLWPYFSGWGTCRKPHYSLHSLSGSSPAALCPSSLHPNTSRHSYHTCHHFHIFFSFLEFDHQVSTRLCWSLAFISLFLTLGIEDSCALWKAPLKICLLCSAALSLRLVSLEDLTNS